MNTGSISGAENAFATLRRLAQPRTDVEQCEFCSALLPGAHRHLFEASTRKIICACDPCALRFDNVVGRWKLIPRDARALPDFTMTDEQWTSLEFPIQLAFCFHSTAAKRVLALYPSPAGATESLLPLNQWETLVAANPRLGQLQPDIEALLINRLGAEPLYFVAPIDLCFELVGLIRLHWRGLSGGDKVWQEIESFFANLKTRTQLSNATRQDVVHA